MPAQLSTLSVVAADPPRLLDKRAGRSYTANPALAMFREPEAVDEATQQRYSDEARRRSADGRLVTFLSRATNLTPDDTNGGVFVRELAPTG